MWHSCNNFNLFSFRDENGVLTEFDVRFLAESEKNSNFARYKPK